ncbi:MAG: hypothetical protein K6A70_09770 [Erysipelotrichaceae bacterium]|nr:hypothetical protein [Erysipelotrichaceae bacterium]
MDYWDYPNEKTGLFESSEKNYYWSTGSRYTYLCSKKESDQIDPWNDLQGYGWVISSYLRYDVIEHGEVIFSNPETENDDKAGRFVIIRDEPFEYTIQSWGERKLISHEVCKEEGFDEALHSVYFISHKKALRKAAELSMKDYCQYIVCRQLGSYDRH